MSDPFDVPMVDENNREHERIYKKFVRLAQLGAFGIPFFAAFLLLMSK